MHIFVMCIADVEYLVAVETVISCLELFHLLLLSVEFLIYPKFSSLSVLLSLLSMKCHYRQNYNVIVEVQFEIKMSA